MSVGAGGGSLGGVVGGGLEQESGMGVALGGASLESVAALAAAMGATEAAYRASGELGG